MKNIPRQIIYKTNILTSFFLSFSNRICTLNRDKLNRLISNAYKFKPKFIGRARAGVLLAVEYAVNKTGNKLCIMSPYTILDIANMVVAGGGIPYFLDFKEDSFEFDEGSLLNLVQLKPACLLITHYFGISKNINLIRKICNDNGIVLIEDCAISIGSSIDNKNVGSFGEIAVFSFSLFKFLNFFWGGAIVCNSSASNSFIDNKINKWVKLNLFDYMPQYTKFVKFSILSNRYIYQLIFLIFKMAILYNWKYILKHMQNDPYLPFTGSYSKSCTSLPSDVMFVELGRKINYFKYQLNSRRIKFQYLMNNIRDKKLLTLSNSINVDKSSVINFPILCKTEFQRDTFKIKLIKNGVDVSTQLYRNIHNTNIEYKSISGSSYNLEKMINRLIFLPIHNEVDNNHLDLIVNIFNEE
jgi:dTDP-4-amino-4,6-dideoxygalactose transaminase